jgi:hypothetical protein
MPAKARERGTVATQRLRKVDCPECGCILYMSRKWIAEGTPTCACGARMQSVDELRDQRELDEWRAREERAAKRGERRSRPGAKRAQCEHCAGFLVHDRDTCSACGHVPDPQVGHRQNHRSPRQQERARKARAQRKRDLMPF